MEWNAYSRPREGLSWAAGAKRERPGPARAIAVDWPFDYNSMRND